MTGSRQRRIRLASAAEDDFRNILRWTAVRFGEAQARVYADTLTGAIETLAAGPRIARAMERNDIAEGLMALHVARKRRRGRYLVLYRIGSPEVPPTIDVLRLLHDSMDLARHFPSGEDDDP